MNIREYIELQQKIARFTEVKGFSRSMFYSIAYIGSQLDIDPNQEIYFSEVFQNLEMLTSKSRLSTATSELLREGLVEKTVRMNDQRVKTLKLTHKGKRVYEELKGLFK